MHVRMFISHFKCLYIFSEIKSSIARSSQSMKLHAPSHSETGTKYYITTNPCFSWEEFQAIMKPDGQCMCKVTIKHIHETPVAVESNRYYISLSRVRACMCVCMWECGWVGKHVALLIQYATFRHHIICVLSGCTTFFDIIS
jgi:hypothetical protein